MNVLALSQTCKEILKVENLLKQFIISGNQKKWKNYVIISIDAKKAFHDAENSTLVYEENFFVK